MSESKSTSQGTSFLSLLTLLFIALKLTKVITWSWWLVLLPLYGLIAAAVLIIIGSAVMIAICTIIEKASSIVKPLFSRRK